MIANEEIIPKLKLYRAGFFGSDAPPPFRLDSWDLTSQKVYAVKHRG